MMSIKGLIFAGTLGLALGRFFSIDQWQFWFYMIGIIIVYNLVEE